MLVGLSCRSYCWLAVLSLMFGLGVTLPAQAVHSPAPIKRSSSPAPASPAVQSMISPNPPSSNAGNRGGLTNPQAATASPTPSPTATPSPTPSPSPLPLFADLPVSRADQSPVVKNRRLSLTSSNSLGMAGSHVAGLPPSDGRVNQAVLLDPGPEGDLAAWRMVTALAGSKGGRWILVDMRASQGKQLLQWQRLLDRETQPESAWFKVFNRYPGGGVQDEQEYRTGQLFRSVSYDKAGNILREYRYDITDSGPEVAEYTEYERQGNRLHHMTVRGPDGSLRQGIAFSYTLEGKVRQIEKQFADGHLESFLFRYGLDGVNETWMDGPQDGLRWVYDREGRLVRMEDWQGGAPVKQVVTTWAAERGTLIASRETTDLVNNVKLLEVFDEQGRLVQSDEDHADELFSRISQVWNPDGTLGERNVLTQGKAESTVWEYKDGVKTTERYSKEGVPVRVTTYQGKIQIDELYLDAQPILRVYYRDTVRYKEEELRNGKVVRTRIIK